MIVARYAFEMSPLFQLLRSAEKEIEKFSLYFNCLERMGMFPLPYLGYAPGGRRIAFAHVDCRLQPMSGSDAHASEPRTSDAENFSLVDAWTWRQVFSVLRWCRQESR
jgi:hypothetical protein